MATSRPRGSSVFSGLLLIFVGVLLLLHNYRGLELSRFFWHWWPLLLIFWGGIKLFERTVGRRAGQPGARISGGEVALVFGLLALMGVVVVAEEVRQRLPEEIGVDFGETYSNDIDVAPKAVPANARITIRDNRGDITVRPGDEPEIRVSGRVSVRGWSESASRRLGEGVSAEIAQNGDEYEVRPTGSANSRVRVEMDVVVPKKASVTARTERGDISISDMETPVSVNGGNGDIEIRNTSGDVSIDMRRGDAKISDTRGDIRISGRGDSIEAVNATGGLIVNGEFVGSIRAERVAKGVRFVSHRTDLTLTQLTGHMEAGAGNLEVVDAPGNLSVRTRDEEIRIENVAGRLKIENRNGSIEVRFSTPPKEDIEIDNASAPITLSMPASSSFDIAADCRSCDEDKGIDSEFSSDSLKQTNESGNWHLEGKYGQGRRPKITLKTTYGGISIHKTS